MHQERICTPMTDLHLIGKRSLQRPLAPSTLLKFRRLLEQHDLGRAIFGQINQHLSEQGLLMRGGTMIDATIIAAPSSTKNKDGQRDPEMHQTKKGNQWHFGLKAHIGADSDSGAVHSVHVTAANESDVANAHHLLHGQESDVHADAGFTGVDKRDEIKAAQDEGRIKADINWHVAERRHKIKLMPEGLIKDLRQALEQVKAQIRARVEHPFHIVKNIFGHKKLRYRGLAKNASQLNVMFGLVNLVLLKRPLLALQGTAAP
ncbi:MAG: IS5 family transposase [Proteobacteria bacterium]|nr:IS5 family transposase [Pseudomonadota bacterium]